MKKYFIICVLIILLFLTACSQEQETSDGDAVVSEADLTDFEKNLTQIIDEKSFIYDIEVNNDDVTEIHTTIDYYENSELVRSIADSSTTFSDADMEDGIRTVFMRKSANERNEQWITSVITSSGSSIAESLNDLEGREELDSSAWGGVISPTPLFLGEKKVIASIVHTNDSSVSVINTIKTEEDLRRATDYEQVYIMSIELK